MNDGGVPLVAPRGFLNIGGPQPRACCLRTGQQKSASTEGGPPGVLLSSPFRPSPRGEALENTTERSYGRCTRVTSPPRVDTNGPSARTSRLSQPSGDAFEAVAVRPGELELRAVVEDDDVLPVEVAPQLAHALAVDDGRAVDADEALGVELLGEVGERDAKEAYVVPRGEV